MSYELGKDYGLNQPVRRFPLEDLLSGRAALQSPLHSKTQTLFRCGVQNQFQVSGDGHWVVGPSAGPCQGDPGRVVKEHFESGETAEFPQTHSTKVNAVVLLEQLNRCCSFGNDGAMGVYKWSSAELLKKVQLDKGPLISSRAMGNLVLLGGWRRALLLDCRSWAVVAESARLDCENVYALGFSVKRRLSGGGQWAKMKFVCGGSRSQSAHFHTFRPEDEEDLQLSLSESRAG